MYIQIDKQSFRDRQELSHLSGSDNGSGMVLIDSFDELIEADNLIEEARELLENCDSCIVAYVENFEYESQENRLEDQMNEVATILLRYPESLLCDIEDVEEDLVDGIEEAVKLLSNIKIDDIKIPNNLVLCQDLVQIKMRGSAS